MSIVPIVFQPTEKQICQLDSIKKPIEIVADWLLREKRWLRSKPRTKHKNTLPRAVREGLARFLEQMCRESGLAYNDWYTTVMFLDIYCNESSKGVHIKTLPAVCAAIVAIVKKFDKSTLERWMKPGFESYIKPACRIAGWLHDNQGYVEVSLEVTEELIGIAEKKVLKSLQWILHTPNYETMVMTYCTRLNVFTEGCYDSIIQSLFRQAPNNLNLPGALRWLTLAQETNADLTPRRIACGLLCQSLVRVGLLPAVALKKQPENKELLSNWDQLFAIAQFRPLPCGLSEEHCSAMLGCLEVVTGCDVATLQDDCECIASVFVELSEKMAQRNVQHTSV